MSHLNVRDPSGSNLSANIRSIISLVSPGIAIGPPLCLRSAVLLFLTDGGGGLADFGKLELRLEFGWALLFEVVELGKF